MGTEKNQDFWSVHFNNNDPYFLGGGGLHISHVVASEAHKGNFNTFTTKKEAVAAKQAVEKILSSETDTNEVVEKGLKTLGLSLESFKKIAGEDLTKHLTPDGLLDLNHAPGIEVIEILELIYLSSSHLYGGYDQEKHLANICHDIERGGFHYKKSKLVKVAWKNFKRERWKYESELLSFRLRWKDRLKRWFLGLSVFWFG